MKPFEFSCPKCRKVHKKGSYCVAQQAMGHSLKFTCDCGHVFVVPKERRK